MKPFPVVAAALYLAFILEALTGYWVWKPRKVASFFPFTVERGEVYTFHVVFLPVFLLFLFFLHTYLSLGRHLSPGSSRKRFLKAGIGVLSLSLFLFFLYLHVV